MTLPGDEIDALIAKAITDLADQKETWLKRLFGDTPTSAVADWEIHEDPLVFHDDGFGHHSATQRVWLEPKLKWSVII